MPIVSWEGRSKAFIRKSGISTSKNGAVQFCAECVITEAPNGKKAPEEYTINAYITMIGQSGVNIAQVEALKESLNWDGKDLGYLQNTDFSSRQVSIKTEFWQNDAGEKKVSVSWINSASGGIKKASEVELTDMQKNFDDLMGRGADAGFDGGDASQDVRFDGGDDSEDIPF